VKTRHQLTEAATRIDSGSDRSSAGLSWVDRPRVVGEGGADV